MTDLERTIDWLKRNPKRQVIIELVRASRINFSSNASSKKSWLNFCAAVRVVYGPEFLAGPLERIEEKCR